MICLCSYAVFFWFDGLVGLVLLASFVGCFALYGIRCVVVWMYYGIAGCFHSLWFWSSLWSPFNVQCNGLMGVVSGFGEYCRSTFWTIYMCLWACCCNGGVWKYKYHIKVSYEYVEKIGGIKELDIFLWHQRQAYFDSWASDSTSWRNPHCGSDGPGLPCSHPGMLVDRNQNGIVVVGLHIKILWYTKK